MENQDHTQVIIEQTEEGEKTEASRELLQNWATELLYQSENHENLQSQIIDQFGQQFIDMGLWFKIIRPPEFNHTNNEITTSVNILDISKYVKPYIEEFVRRGFIYWPDIPKLYYLTSPSAGAISGIKSTSMGWNKAYHSNPFFDLSLSKAVSVANVDDWNDQSAQSAYHNVILEYNTQLMTHDHKAEAVLNYYHNYKMEYNINRQKNGFAKLDVSIYALIKEFDKNHKEVLNQNGSMGYTNDFVNVGVDTRKPGSSPGQKIVNVSSQKLRSIHFNARKDHYYKIYVRTYAYCWLGGAKGAAQIEFQSINNNV